MNRLETQLYGALEALETQKAGPGGARAGAGRKPRLDGKARTVPKSFKVSQEVADYLAEVGSGVIEDALRRTKAFQLWAAKINSPETGADEAALKASE